MNLKNTTMEIEKNKRKYQQTKQIDGIKALEGKGWVQATHNRIIWKNLEEAYIQQWVDKKIWFPLILLAGETMSTHYLIYSSS